MRQAILKELRVVAGYPLQLKHFLSNSRTLFFYLKRAGLSLWFSCTPISEMFCLSI